MSVFMRRTISVRLRRRAGTVPMWSSRYRNRGIGSALIAAFAAQAASAGPPVCVVLDGGNARYDFGANRVATLALLTITTLPGRRSCGTATAKFSGHAFTFRSSPTVFAETRMSGSACTRILSGKPPRAIWRAHFLPSKILRHDISLQVNERV